LAAAALVVIGCTPTNPNAPARVTGRVTYNGSPVTGGSITFHPKDGGAPFTVGIAADGNYSAFDVRDGDMTVTVETESINPNKKMQEYKGGSASGPGKMYGKVSGGGGAPGGKGAPLSPTPEGASVATQYMKIPDKYKDAATSGLTVTLKKGEQKHDFPLTD